MAKTEDLNYTEGGIDTDSYDNGVLQTKKEWLEFLTNLIKWINVEIEIAKKAHTNNGNQSILIYNIILVQLIKKQKDLKQAIHEHKVFSAEDSNLHVKEHEK